MILKFTRHAPLNQKISVIRNILFFVAGISGNSDLNRKHDLKHLSESTLTGYNHKQIHSSYSFNKWVRFGTYHFNMDEPG